QFCAGLYEGGKDACRVRSSTLQPIGLSNRNTLQGDSGGPMLERVVTYDQTGRRVREQYQVVGIVSAGIGKHASSRSGPSSSNTLSPSQGCALPKLPGIYTRV